jgi:N-acyl homoserine lactone hydrolase
MQVAVGTDMSAKSNPWAIVTLLLIAAWLAPARGVAAAAADVRLYALDCGHASFKDMGMFSDTGEYDGKSGEIADPCFVIRHPKGVLLWDTGLGDKFGAPGLSRLSRPWRP